MMKMGCRNIETTAMEVFSRHGWRFSNIIVLYMWLLETLFLFSLAQNFVFDIPCTTVLLLVIRNSYMHWSMHKLGY